MEVIIWFMFAVGCALVAQSKGKNVAMWFGLGVFGGIFALIIVALLPAENQGQQPVVQNPNNFQNQGSYQGQQVIDVTPNRKTLPDDEDRLFCQVAQDLGLITPEETEVVLHQQRVDAAVGSKQPVVKYLYEKGKISKEQISQIIKVQERMRNR